jgi:hypothetical protein
LTVSFLDEDELAPAPEGPGSRRPGADRHRQVVVRRMVALGAAVLILILILLGIRGCLDARKERGFDNYVSDLGAVAAESQQLSNNFFSRLQDPPKGLDDLGIEAQIATDRNTAEKQLQRIQGLDTPDELAEAQAQLEDAFTLRRDGLAGIAADIPTALGEEGHTEAIARMVGDMEAFLASDVLYRRAQTDIEEVLNSEQIDGAVPDSEFLPPPHSLWLDRVDLAGILVTFATEAGVAPPGVHGLALISTTLDRTELIPDSENTIGLRDPSSFELTVEVQNQGDTEEKEVAVIYTLSGGGTSFDAESTVASIDAQGVAETTIRVDAELDTGVPLTLQVEVLPVIGEGIFDNNAATYTVTFD